MTKISLKCIRWGTAVLLDRETLSLWLTIDGVFLGLFLFGSLCFAVVVFRSTHRGA